MREDWVETTLGEVADWSSGKHLPPARRAGGGRYPVLGANGVIGRTDSVLHNEDLITVGRVGACGETHRTSGPVWVSDNALVALPKPQVAFEFLYHFLASFDYRSITSGTTQPLITQGKLKAQPILLPPLHEQHRIVDLVSSVDDYIESLQRQVDATRTARNAVLEDLLTAGGEDWVETTLGEICTVERTRQLATELPLGTTYIGLEHIDSGALRLTRFGRTDDVSGQVAPFQRGDTLFGRLRPYLHKVVLAQGAGVCSPEILVLRANPHSSAGFLFLLCSRDSTISEATRLSAGSRMPRTSVQDLYSIQVYLPPLHEQHRIVDLVSSLDDATSAAEGALNNAKEMRKGLLSELLSGEHRIPETYDELLKSA